MPTCFYYLAYIKQATLEWGYSLTPPPSLSLHKRIFLSHPRERGFCLHWVIYNNKIWDITHSRSFILRCIHTIHKQWWNIKGSKSCELNYIETHCTYFGMLSFSCNRIPYVGVKIGYPRKIGLAQLKNGSSHFGGTKCPWFKLHGVWDCTM